MQRRAVQWVSIGSGLNIINPFGSVGAFNHCPEGRAQLGPAFKKQGHSAPKVKEDVDKKNRCPRANLGAP